jgi:hypothetical protein
MTELATIDHPAAGHLTGWGTDLVIAAQIAERVAGTEFVPTAMRGKPDVVVAAILYGAELGIDPMTALQSIHVVEGRPAPSAELMRALIFRAGHTLTVHESSGTRCRVSGLRLGEPETERTPVEWTLDMARAAGLLGRTNWQRYPRAMLLARATSDLARMIFPDVVKGLGYIAEDGDQGAALESWGPPEPQPPADPVAPPRKALQRARRPRRDAPIQDAELPPVEPPPEADPPVAPLVEAATAPEAPPAVPTLPDLEPEPAPPEPPPSGSLISPGPLRALQAGLTKQLGTAATREEKHQVLAAILGKPVESAKDLTRAEGMKALDWLGRIAAGEASLVMGPDSTWTVQSLEEPPEEPELPIEELPSDDQ